MRGLDAAVPRSYAAEVLGVSRQRVHQLITAGALAEVRLGRARLVSGRSLRALVRERRRLNDAAERGT